LGRFCSALRRFAIAQGAPNLYHETITVSFVLLINERLAMPGAAASWEAFAAGNADLLSWKPSILDRFYSPETLASERAQTTFVPPDRLSAFDGGPGDARGHLGIPWFSSLGGPTRW
jgi:hypothetical protein